MELVNREQNYNKLFSANPMVGVLDPLAHKDKVRSVLVCPVCVCVCVCVRACVGVGGCGRGKGVEVLGIYLNLHL